MQDGDVDTFSAKRSACPESPSVANHSAIDDIGHRTGCPSCENRITLSTLPGDVFYVMSSAQGE
jgi:hypothetical protein